MENEVRTKVVTEMSRVLGIDAASLVDDAQLIRDLGADSLDLVEILMPVEEYFGVDAGQAGLDQVATVGDFVAHVLAAMPAVR
jgi:acyl carrier protein